MASQVFVGGSEWICYGWTKIDFRVLDIDECESVIEILELYL